MSVLPGDSQRRRYVVLFVIGLVLVTTGAYAATTLTAETRGAVPVGASDGPKAGVTADRTDLTDFSINQSAARVATSDGTIVIDGQADAYARIDRFEGAWTNISDVDTNGGEIRISPADKQLATVAGDIDGFRWRSAADTALDDGEVDLYYNGSAPEVTVGGMAPNTEVAAISDHTEVPEILDTAMTDASGRATFDDLNGGEHDVRLRQRPETLQVRNESAPGDLVTGNATNPVEVEIRFYLGDASGSPNQIVTRETTDGEINMTGLPPDESFVVVANAEGYHPRRIFVESLLQQETVYLLPESETVVQKLYQLSDFTGLYPQAESVLKIQRGINGSWETVQGDFFGASGEFEAVLERNVRHRLVILNTQTGNRRPLGRVTPLNSGTSEIEIQSEDEISLNRIGPIVSLEPQVRALPAGETDVTISLNPVASTIASWNYTVELVSESGSRTTLASDTLPEADSITQNYNLSGESSSRLVVSTGWETSDGRSMVSSEAFRIVAQYDNDHSLLGGLADVDASLTGEGGNAATTLMALLFAVFGAATVATTFRTSTESVGLSAIGILTIFAIVGWISYAVVFSCAVVWTALVALRRGF